MPYFANSSNTQSPNVQSAPPGSSGVPKGCGQLRSYRFEHVVGKGGRLSGEKGLPQVTTPTPTTMQVIQNTDSPFSADRGI